MQSIPGTYLNYVSRFFFVSHVAAYRGWLSSTNLGDSGIWEDQDEDGETKNTLSFKGTGLKT
jgi:hypothetical protein